MEGLGTILLATFVVAIVFGKAIRREFLYYQQQKLGLLQVATKPMLPENVRPIRPSPVDNFLRRQTFADKSRSFRLGSREIPSAHKKRVVVPLDEIKKTASEPQYPYEGKCACRTIYLGSYGVLKDVTVRCERCDQPFVFKYSL